MPSASDRIDFGPSRDPASARAFGLALLAHGLLIAALTWGLNWKSTDRSTSFEAELWSSVPQEAAPKLALPPPPPAPAPVEPAPKTPELKAPPPPPAPDPDIALAQEKKRRLLQQQKETQAQKAVEKQKAEVLAKKEKDQKLKQEQVKQEQDKQEQDKRKALEEAKKLEAKKQGAREQNNSAALAEQRKQNLARTMGLAGATGAEGAKGSAQKSSGPSASYGGKIRAKVKPNIVFTDDISGNPSAEVEVRTSPDGTILSQRLVKPSGNKAWDDAVIKAIIRTETMPRDVDGRVPTPMTLVFTPKDL